MTAQQYLLSQADFCRRAAVGSADVILSEELYRLAEQFELSARGVIDVESGRSGFDAPVTP